MKIIALFGGACGLPVLRHLYGRQYVSALICPEPSIGIETEGLESWAFFRGVPCWHVDQASLARDLDELITEIVPDLVLMYGFPYAVPAQLLQRVKLGGWNVQFSLYPSATQADITIHQLAAGIDGQVLRQGRFSLLPFQKGGYPIEQLSLLSLSLLQDALAHAKAAQTPGV